MLVRFRAPAFYISLVALSGVLTSAPALAQAPTITARNPARNAVAAPVAGPVTVQFSTVINAASAANVRVFGSQRRGLRPGTLSGAGTTSLSFQPTQAFAPGEQVSVTLPATVLGTNGVAARPEVYQFYAAAGAGPADFAGGPTLSLPGQPGSVAAGDVDNDGDLDLVAANGAASIRLNDGTGTFSAAADLTAPASGTVTGVALADVNGDGDLDLLTTGNGRLDTWHNTGGGSFAFYTSLTLNGVLNTPVLADVDADGDLDALLANPGYRAVQVRLNDGAGTFGGGTDVPMRDYVYTIAVADLDGDGDLDFAGAGAANGNFTSGYVNVRLNSGTGTFASAPDLTTAALSNSVALGDLDGDGDADLVVGSTIRASNVLLNSGNGTFVSTPDVPTGANTAAVTLADVDGDGDLDLLHTQSNANAIAWSPNDGTGHFAAPRIVAVGNSPQALVLADLDGDLALDIATADYRGNTLSVRLNHLPAPTITAFAPGSGPAGTSVSISGTGFGTTTTVRFNGVAAGFVLNSSTMLTATVPPGASTGPITVTTAGGTAASATSYAVMGPPAPTVLSRSPARNSITASPAGSVALTFSQALAAGTAAELRVWGSRSGGRRPGPVSGGGTATLSVSPAVPFLPGETVQVSLPASVLGTTGAAARPEVYQFTTASGYGRGQFRVGGNVTALVAPVFTQPADMDGDGDLDLITGLATGVQLFDNNGRGTFTPGRVVASFPRTQYTSPGDVVTADVDNDGDLDILDAAGGYFRNNGSSFASTPIASLAAISSRLLKVGDLDADGDLDLIVVGTYTGEVVALLNDGSGNFGGVVRVIASGSGYSDDIAVADVDNDGDLDVLATSRAAGAVVLSRNDGRGTFSPRETVATITNPVALQLGDLDGDGDLDLAYVIQYDPAGNTLFVRRNDGQGNFGAAAQLAFDSGVFSLHLADINGDGRLDLVADASGEVCFALNNGTGGFLPVARYLFDMAAPRGLSLADYNGDGALDIGGILVTAAANQPLLLLNQLPEPVITRFTPTFGLAGTVVTVTGQHFIDVLSVDLNGLPVSGLVVASATSLSFTVPPGATSGYIHVYTGGGSASSPGPFNVTNVPPDLDVISPVDVTGTYHDVTIYSYSNSTANLVGPLTVTGTLTVRSGGTLLTNCQPVTGPGAFVMQPGGTLSICDPAGISLSGPTGAIQLSGPRTFSDQGFYTYNGIVAQVTGSGLPAQVRNLTLDNPAGLTLSQPLGLSYLLRLSRGDLRTGGRALTLLSSFGGQGWVDNTGGVVVGDATVQRFVLPYRNPGPGYRHFSSPIANATVGSLATAGFAPVVNPAYNTAAQPGLVTPFPTVYGYDQARSSSTTSNFSDFDKGWVSPAGPGDPLAPGRGYSVNLNGGLTVAFTGPLNNGPITLPLARAATPVADGGWQLLGNPYPAPLDWSRVTIPAGVEPALYYFQSTSAYGGSYARYVNGIGNPVLDVGQGFFVRVAQPGTALSLTLTNAARRIDANPAEFQRATTDTRPQLALRLTSAAGLADEAIVYFEAGATAAFDPAYDARQVAAPSGGEPAVWAVASGGEALGISGLPPLGAAGAVVPLGVALPGAGPFTFSVPNPQYLAGQAVWLDDAATGRSTRLDGGGSYTFSAGVGALGGRFSLRFGPATPLATTATALAAGVSVYPNPARAALTVRVPAVVGVSTFRIELLNALGQRVAQAQAALAAGGGALVLPLTGQAAGLYVVRVHLGAECVSRRVVVE
jgi:hypothetical protein